MLSTVAVPVALRARLPLVNRPAPQAQRTLRATHAAPLRGAGPGGRSRWAVVVHASGSEAPQVRGCPLQRHRKQIWHQAAPTQLANPRHVRQHG
jgi:hypothetical protein